MDHYLTTYKKDYLWPNLPGQETRTGEGAGPTIGGGGGIGAVSEPGGHNSMGTVISQGWLGPECSGGCVRVAVPPGTAIEDIPCLCPVDSVPQKEFDRCPHTGQPVYKIPRPTDPQTSRNVQGPHPQQGAMYPQQPPHPQQGPSLQQQGPPLLQPGPPHQQPRPQYQQQGVQYLQQEPICPAQRPTYQQPRQIAATQMPQTTEIITEARDIITQTDHILLRSGEIITTVEQTIQQPVPPCCSHHSNKLAYELSAFRQEMSVLQSALYCNGQLLERLLTVMDVVNKRLDTVEKKVADLERSSNTNAVEKLRGLEAPFAVQENNLMAGERPVFGPSEKRSNSQSPEKRSGPKTNADVYKPERRVSSERRQSTDKSPVTEKRSNSRSPEKRKPDNQSKSPEKSKEGMIDISKTGI